MSTSSGKINRIAAASLASLLAATPCAFAQEAAEEKKPRERVSAEVDRRAKHLYDKAIELMEYKQHERGLAMLNTVVRDNQGTLLAHMAHMAMGKHYLDQRKTKEALNHFMLLTRLLAPEPGEKQSDEVIALYHEALYQAGFSQYQAGQYAAGFPLFRRLTEVAARTKWANMAYFYIGMSHYQLKNWNKAIDSLSLVGTEVEEVPMIWAGSKLVSVSTPKSWMPMCPSCASSTCLSRPR